MLCVQCLLGKKSHLQSFKTPENARKTIYLTSEVTGVDDHLLETCFSDPQSEKIDFALHSTASKENAYFGTKTLTVIIRAWLLS